MVFCKILAEEAALLRVNFISCNQDFISQDVVEAILSENIREQSINTRSRHEAVLVEP